MKFTKSLVFLACLVPAGWITWAFFSGNLGANPIREAEIQSGFWTLRFLAIALTVTPLRQITGWNQLAKYRRMLGLFTFFYACCHLALWFVDWWFDWSAMGEEIVKKKYILVGMLTFLMLLALAITSTDGWIRRLKKNWVKLHRLVYVAAITGTIHYLWAVSSKEGAANPAVYFVIFAVLLGYRLVAWRRKAKLRA